MKYSGQLYHVFATDVHSSIVFLLTINCVSVFSSLILTFRGLLSILHMCALYEIKFCPGYWLLIRDSENMSQANKLLTADKLYEDAYQLHVDWQKVLPPSVYNYHELIFKESNAPIGLQMGNILPFVASCVGPTTHGLFFTRPSCLNLFWITIAASGAGKSQSRQRFISEPLEYILKQQGQDIKHFELSKFTRAGNYN